MRQKVFLRLAALFLIIVINLTTTPAFAAVVVTLSPTSFTTPIGGTRQLIAQVSGTTNTAVTWSVNNIVGGNSTVGTIDSTGKYTAPAAAPSGWTVTIKAASVVDANAAATCVATVQMGVGANVTTFTLSDFGRTLQPSGSGSDHGWGNHHLVIGGAVGGGNIFGAFPLMTNYGNFNSTNDDYADSRGVLLPGLGLAQYGATMAKWFGASQAQLDSLFPTLTNFALRDIGFLS